MQLIFIRHGESDANVERIISNRDMPHYLTERGREQAHAVSNKLASGHVTAIYTSPIRRAQQTAEIIAEKLHVPVYTSDALREFDCGIMEGRGDEDAWLAHHSVIKAWDDEQDYAQRITGGESFYDMQKRFVPFIKNLVDEFAEKDGDIVLLSHGGLLNRMLPLVLLNIDRSFAKDYPLGNCACVFAAWQGAQLVCTKWDGIRPE